MLQISFIILFRIPLKISSLCSILFFLCCSFYQYYSLFTIIKLSSYVYIHMQSCTNNTIIIGLRLHPSLLCMQPGECSRDSHSPGCTYSEQARIVSSYSVYLCYFFCMCYFVKYSCIILDYAQIIPHYFRNTICYQNSKNYSRIIPSSLAKCSMFTLQVSQMMI